MTLFTKPISSINYDDVVSFCEQGISEGINLDYKRDFPEQGKLEKTISAFANTFGGVVIIGIADQDSKPKPPFEGIEYREKFEERITNIILDNIYPPLFPEIGICPPKDNKTFIIIRVPESNETPHAIYNNTQVYIRTGNRNKPEDMATIDQIEWLRNRRKKSEELSENLYRRAKERYLNICESKKVKSEFAEFTLSLCPLYPQKPLIPVEKIEDIFMGIEVDDGRLRFPRMIDGGILKPIQDGMYYFAIQEDTRFFTYSEINKFGLVFYKEDSGWYNKEENTRKVYAVHIIGTLLLIFESAYKFYKQVGYWGLVKVKFSLDRLLGVQFVSITRNDIRNRIFGPGFPSKIEENCAADQLSWELTFNVAQLEDPGFRKDKLIELGRDIHWSFGAKIEKYIIEQFLKERNR